MGMVSNVGVASNMVKAFNMGVASNMGMAFNISVANKREPEKQRKKRERSSDCNDGREKGVASNGVWVGERERESDDVFDDSDNDADRKWRCRQ